MTFILCTSGAAFAKAGAGATDLFETSGSFLVKLEEFSDQAEAAINTATRKDWIANYTNVTTNFKGILGDTASDLIAMKIINYDMSGYTSRLEAQTMLDVLRDNSKNNLKILEVSNAQEIMD